MLSTSEIFPIFTPRPFDSPLDNHTDENNLCPNHKTLKAKIIFQIERTQRRF